MTKDECEIETSKAIMEMRKRIEELDAINKRIAKAVGIIKRWYETNSSACIEPSQELIKVTEQFISEVEKCQTEMYVYPNDMSKLEEQILRVCNENKNLKGEKR